MMSGPVILGIAAAAALWIMLSVIGNERERQVREAEAPKPAAATPLPPKPDAEPAATKKPPMTAPKKPPPRINKP